MISATAASLVSITTLAREPKPVLALGEKYC